ncbi:MAG: hypothetical protein PUA85_00140 [Oscillospiraceae bacterium]|nr:hypothetical protein [Oscillospiraceae bacterium]
MKNKRFIGYYLFSCIGVLIASYYPLSMGVRVITDMIVDGTVLKENYPKYIIPYSPICIAIIIGVILMPLCIKLLKKFALVGGALVSTGIFFALELLFEHKVIVSTAENVVKLADWQMAMCYVHPEGWGETVTTYKTQTAVDILMGEYNPAFKLHFYIISVVLIITILNCIYGFGQIIKTGKKNRLKSLILQSVCSLLFLGLCILACFTAFWRDGSIQVSPLSATLMTLFFVLLGVTLGVFVGSFLLGKRKLVSIFIPSVVASAMTLLMYVGEMILLNGHLYRFGTGFIFNDIPGIVLAPIDLLIIIISGFITAYVFYLINCGQGCSKNKKIIFTLGIVGFAVVLALLLVFGNGGNSEAQVAFGSVKFIDEKSDEIESSYTVEAELPKADFSSIGKTLEEKIAQSWETYDGMTETQRPLSSTLWGVVEVQADSWSECEDIIGFSINNPLESITWLSKSEYFGMESTAPTTPAKHIKINANAATPDRKLSSISITSGYNIDGVRVTLSATLIAVSNKYTTDSVTNGYATYEQETVNTGSGDPVLVVITDETNNTGYYNGDYFDPTAYWVENNVFYTLRVIGDEADKSNIQDILYRILNEI